MCWYIRIVLPSEVTGMTFDSQPLVCNEYKTV